MNQAQPVGFEHARLHLLSHPIDTIVDLSKANDAYKIAGAELVQEGEYRFVKGTGYIRQESERVLTAKQRLLKKPQLSYYMLGPFSPLADHEAMRQLVEERQYAHVHGCHYRRVSPAPSMRWQQPAHAQETVTKVSNAELSVLHERSRQIDKGFTHEHDDQYTQDELTRAAESYLFAWDAEETAPFIYPWPRDTWRPGTRRENLVKAAALIIAEIERCDRLKQSSTAGLFSSSTPTYPLARR